MRTSPNDPATRPAGGGDCNRLVAPKSNEGGSAIASVLLALAMGCASAKAPPPSVHVPEGLVAVTEKQQALVTWVRGLKGGVSKRQVENALGTPTQRAKDVWVYHVPESRVHGGYYVTAALTFDRQTLSGAELAYGHETREPRADH